MIEQINKCQYCRCFGYCAWDLMNWATVFALTLPLSSTAHKWPHITLEKGLIVSRCAVVHLCFSYSLCANLTLFVIPPRWRWRRPTPPPAAIYSSYRLASDESQRQGNCVPPELKTTTTTATAAEKTKNEKGSRQLPHINWSTSEMVDDNNNSKKQYNTTPRKTMTTDVHFRTSETQTTDGHSRSIGEAIGQCSLFVGVWVSSAN